MKEKKWYQSSTIWINLVGIFTIGLELAVKSNLIPDADVVAIIVSVLNILNRFRVQKPSDVQSIEKSIS